MAKGRGDFADILLKKKMISAEQLAEAESVASSAGIKLQDALVKQQYLTANEVMSAIAEHYGMQFVDLAEVQIPKSVIELVPESVARDAEAAGLLQSEALERLLREEIKRRRVEQLFAAADRLAALDLPPLTESEVEAEIQAARTQRRAAGARER